MVRWLSRGKKEEKVEKIPERVQMTDLEKICNEKEVCEALWHTMFYDPRKISVTLEDAAKKAADFEKKGDDKQTRIWYHIAGGLALWKGDAAKAKQYFSKCAKLAPQADYETITKVPEKAVETAQEFYKKFLT